MKTRHGFVSNSSSSSFVVVGSRIPKSDIVALGWYDDECGPHEDKLPEGISCYYDENAYIVGQPICMSEDWGLVGGELNLTELNEIFYQVTRKLPNREIKLLMGIRPT